MKELLGAVGPGALLCLPCLAVIGGASLMALGGGLVAFATNPAAQGAGALVLVAALSLGPWYASRRRRTCPDCGVRAPGHRVHAVEQQPPLP